MMISGIPTSGVDAVESIFRLEIFKATAQIDFVSVYEIRFGGVNSLAARLSKDAGLWFVGRRKKSMNA